MLKKLGLITILTLSSAAPAAAQFDVPEGAMRIQTALLAEHRDIPRCDALQAAYAASDLPKSESISALKRIDWLVRRSGRYRADGRQESWDSFAKEVIAGKRNVSADCDDHALTAIALAVCAGVPPERLDFALTQSDRGKLSFRKINHAVAIYTDPEGNKWVMGDTKGVMSRLDARTKVVLWANASRIGSRRVAWQSNLDPASAKK